jgi:hypothetical protein
MGDDDQVAVEERQDHPSGHDSISACSNSSLSLPSRFDTIVMDTSIAKNPQRSFGKFTTPLPESLIGYRIAPHMQDVLLVEEQCDSLAHSISEDSDFSSSFVVDHARYGSMTLGSVGRIGDQHTEPIHNAILMVVSFVLLLFAVPFYLKQSFEVPSPGIPTWVYFSLQVSVMAGLTMVYVMFSSWDIPATLSKVKTGLNIERSLDSRKETFGTVETTRMEHSIISITSQLSSLRKGAIQRQSSAARPVEEVGSSGGPISSVPKLQRYVASDQFSITDVGTTLGSFSISADLQSIDNGGA